LRDWGNVTRTAGFVIGITRRGSVFGQNGNHSLDLTFDRLDPGN